MFIFLKPHWKVIQTLMFLREKHSVFQLLTICGLYPKTNFHQCFFQWDLVVFPSTKSLVFLF